MQCNRATKARLLDEFSHSLDGFLDENPDATFADLSNAFGPPEDMAQILMAELSKEDIRQYRLQIQFVRICAGLCAAVFLLFVAYVFFEKQKPLIFSEHIKSIEPFTSNEGE